MALVSASSLPHILSTGSGMTDSKAPHQDNELDVPQLNIDVGALSRIRSLLGEEAAESYTPMWHNWVQGGLIAGEKFKIVGDYIVAACVAHGGLQPRNRVLDVGCGIGRITLPLLCHLAPSGSYEGFDVIASGINWLRKYVTPRFPNFRFRLADRIYSGLYNPNGDSDASYYSFCYRQGSFDFAVAVSVFTHMAPSGVSHYLSETARMLKPGGRLMCTAYLLDDEAVAMVAAARSAISFPNDFGTYRLRNLSMPESAIAFDEKYFLHSAAEAGLYLTGEIHRGSWRNYRNGMSQDLVILERRKQVNALGKPSSGRSRARAPNSLLKNSSFGLLSDGIARLYSVYISTAR